MAIEPRNIILNFVTNADEATKEVDNLKTKVRSVGDAVKKSGKEGAEGMDKYKGSTEEASKAIDRLDDLTGGLITQLKNLVASVKAFGVATLNGMKSALAGTTLFSKGLQLLKVALISTGIGAFVVILGSLVAAFSASEAGQNKFRKALAIVGSVVANIVDLFADLGDAIIWAFENPQKAWEGLKKSLSDGMAFIKRQIVDRWIHEWNMVSGIFQGLVLKMRIAWNEFTGDSEEANELKARLEEVNKATEEARAGIAAANQEIVDGYNKAKDAVIGFTNELKEEARLSAQIADARDRARIIDRELLVERSKQEAVIERLKLQSRMRDEYDANQRISFLKQAIALEDALLVKEIESAKIKRDAALQEGTIAKDRDEALDAQAEAIAEVNRLEAQRSSKKRELFEEMQSITNEERARVKALEDQFISLRNTYEGLLEGNRVAQMDPLEKIRYDAMQSIEAIKLLETALKNSIDAANKADGGKRTFDTSGVTDYIEDVKKQAAKLRKPFEEIVMIPNLLGRNANDGMKAALDQATENFKDWSEEINAEVAKPEGPLQKLRKGIVDALGITDEDFDKITSGFSDALTTITQAQTDRLDALVDAQQRKVDRLIELAEEGKTEQLQIERERLRGLEEEREKNLARQRQFAAVEIAINQALAASSTIAAVTAGFAKGGNVAAGIINAVLLVAQVAAASIAISNAFGDIPSYYEGIENTKRGNLDSKGGFKAILHPNERVVPEKYNNHLVGIRNDELPKMAEVYKSYKNPMAFMNDVGTKIDTGFVGLKKELSKLNESIEGLSISTTIDKNGIKSMLQGRQSKFNKLGRS